MPINVGNGNQAEGRVNEMNGFTNPSPTKKAMITDKSPKSPLSPPIQHQRTLSGTRFPTHGVVGSSSLKNVWDGADPNSPSAKSCGDEPRIDSLLSSTTDSPKKAEYGIPFGLKAIITKSVSRGRTTPTPKPPANKNESVLKTQTSMNRSKPPFASSVSKSGADYSPRSILEKPEMAHMFLKQARDLMSVGESPQKALEAALQALRIFEKAANGKRSLDLVMCLHVTAAIYCSLGQYDKAIPIIECSIEIPVVEEGLQNALAKFSGYMQLGDTYAMLGQIKNAISYYSAGLELQEHVLGDTDPRVGETCRYVAEANVQAFQLDEAERLCQMALDIHRENSSPQSLEEAADRRLMGLICETKGNHEAALEHLVFASLAMVANGQEVEVASVDCSIGDTFISLARYDEAIVAFQKALKVFKASKGVSHPAVAQVYVRLAELYNRTWKLKESRFYCEKALEIYENPMDGVPPEDIATGLTSVSVIYESMGEPETALNLLHKSLVILTDVPGQQRTVAGIEAQIGVINYMLGRYKECYDAMVKAIAKLRASGDKTSAYFGIALNQMGLACVQLHALNEAAELFEEAKIVLEKQYGPYNSETLGVYSNLAGAYDGLGRVDDAIDILDYIVEMRESKLGTANPDVVDEKRRLDELLKQTGRVRSRKGRSLDQLLDGNVRTMGDLIFLNA
ncbi:Protein KINESIN LIGHT CHAIN-RELATED 3 [Stylosanthes scabra]|uniref:Protein KINESIN LIGHT CHAIN-RELATED 3 n=1 Tax=Stylosanthes scabra TaxID=79078 RepID=A0ABU6Q3C9_9FABA|nr:Protein KINESIN LIGHT CHAIN-RELATED 3 [Stylosanthes scabra]